MGSPKVTVIMTAYNNLAYLPDAINSVLAQDYGDFEVIVIDDGSTVSVKDCLAENTDGSGSPLLERVELIRQENTGLAGARNTGIEAANGEYLTFCDDDDIQHPFRVPLHAALLDRYPKSGQVFSDLQTWTDGEVTVESTLRDRVLGPTPRTFDQELAATFGSADAAVSDLDDSALGALPDAYRDRKIYRGNVPQLIATYHCAWGGASMYRTDAIRAIGGHDASLRRWPCWGVASLISKRFELVYADLPVLKYRQHAGQLTKKAELGHRCYHHLVDTVWRNDQDFARKFPEIHARVVHHGAMRMARVHMLRREWSLARPLLRQAMAAQPRDRRSYTAYLRSLAMSVRDRVMPS